MRYDFRIAGLVSEAVADAFPELDRTPPSGSDTLFCGAHVLRAARRFQSLSAAAYSKCGSCPIRAGPLSGG